jgi:hypothetical protein
MIDSAFVVALVTILGLVSCDPIKRVDWKELDGNHHRKIAGFYNVYCEGESYDGIIKDQVKKMEESSLLDKMDIVYYATIGRNGANYSIPNPKFKHIQHFGDVGYEVQTLSLLYEFCKENSESKVLYFHNKGSFHDNWTNRRFRQYLDCFNLNPNCIDALETHDTCGWRISPVPHPHYSGNFWWARCQHINKLVDPLSSTNNQTFMDATNTLSNCIGSRDRYFPEAWVGSAPRFRPADCMSASIDLSYVFGYRFPNGIAEQYCPKVNDVTKQKEYGLKCDTASTMLHISEFSGSINYMTALGVKLGCSADVYPEIIKRSFLWYGVEPKTYIEWLAPLRTPPNMTEGDLFRGVNSKQVYVVRDNLLRGIPNLKTFMTLGRDFDEVHVVNDYIIAMMPMGPDLPSVRR